MTIIIIISVVAFIIYLFASSSRQASSESMRSDIHNQVLRAHHDIREGLEYRLREAKLNKLNRDLDDEHLESIAIEFFFSQLLQSVANLAPKYNLTVDSMRDLIIRARIEEIERRSKRN